jgi:hypothetical protein
MTDFFDLPTEDFVSKAKKQGRQQDPNIYNPDPNQFNGSYKSVFRYLPYIFDKTKSKYTKYAAKFYNPLTKESLFVDCPSNVGKPSILWDIESVIRSIKEEEPELHEELSNNFSRWHNHFSPIYIKKDPQRPELEGTIKFFKFSAQINNLIEAQINPEEDDLLENSRSINPYHLLEGKDFLCVVGKKTKTFRDWSKSKFMEDVTPFIFKVGDKTVKVENSEKSIKLVQEFLKKNTPSIDEYLHNEWDDETFNKVADAIVSCINNRTILNMVLERSKHTEMVDAIRARLEGSGSSKKSAPKMEAEDLVFGSDESSDTPFEPEAESSESGDYDSIFDDL